MSQMLCAQLFEDAALFLIEPGRYAHVDREVEIAAAA